MFGQGGAHPKGGSAHMGHAGPVQKRPDRLRSAQADSMAHPSHHQANVDHGTPMGFAPQDGYLNGGCDHHLGDNISEQD